MRTPAEIPDSLRVDDRPDPLDKDVRWAKPQTEKAVVDEAFDWLDARAQ